MPKLSKSKLIAFRQCPKRLWLELNKPGERDDSGSEASFAIGNEVGELACSVFDPQGVGINLDPNLIGWAESYSRTAEELRKGERPLFEAVLRCDGALALADVMLPDRSNGELRWKMIEVKSSTSVKDYHRDDAAIQTYIAKQNGVKLSMVGLAHINTAFVYQGDGDYSGLFAVEDYTEETFDRDTEVRLWLDSAQTIAGCEEEVSCEMGGHCKKPYPCGFQAYCNRLHGNTENFFTCLPGIGENSKKPDQWLDLGFETLQQLPDSELNPIQLRVKNCTLENREIFERNQACEKLADGSEDVYFLDFETINLVIPRWKGTRPYQKVPFQYSLHLRHPNGEMVHKEFLDLTGEDPRKGLAQQLVTDCGTTGVIYAYNMGFEKGVIRELAEVAPHLKEQLVRLHDRIDDLLPICRKYYYHPSQKGSWSLKAVLPAMCPELNYQDLDDVQNGGDAMDAYRKAIDPKTSAEQKSQLRERMLAYCKLDTYATVRIWERFLGM